MNLNYSSNVPVPGSNAANVGPSPPRNQQSSSGLSSVVLVRGHLFLM